MMKKRNLALAFAFSCTLGLAACGGGHDLGAEIGVSDPEIRFLNASATSPALDFYLNGALLASQSNLAYRSVGGYQTFNNGTTTASLNQAGTTTQLATAAFSAANGHRYTAVAFPGLASGAVSNPAGDATASLTTSEFVIDDPFDKGILNDQARLRFLNGSYNAQAVDVYVVPNTTTDLSAISPTFSNVAYGAAAPASGQDSIYLDGGNYHIEITANASKTAIYDSGTVNLDNNDDLLITSVPETGAGAVLPNSLRVVLANGQSNTSQDLPNAQTANTAGSPAVAP